VETHLIFTLSPGRCGTGYLAKMLQTVPGVEARHEGKPDFVEVARDAQHDPEIARLFWLERKLPYIATLNTAVYAETSHLFVHGFAQALLDLNIPADLIVLTRPHREVALSYWQRGSIPGTTKRGKQYLLDPTGSVLLPVRGWDSLNRYQRCYWHCLEVEARCDALTTQYVAGNVCYTSLAQVTTQEGFLTLLRCLGLPEPRPQYESRREWVVNANPAAYKRNVIPDDELDRLEAEVCERVS
jgi:hypothetical protein